MEHIAKLITFAIANTGEEVCLKVEQEPNLGPFNVSLINEYSGSVLTLATDWEREFAVSGVTVLEALQRLDALCAEDLGEVSA